MDNVVSNIKAFRKAMGMTQKELAERIGTKISTIACYENGYREPNINTLVAIYKALGIKLTLTYEAIQGGEDE